MPYLAATNSVSRWQFGNCCCYNAAVMLQCFIEQNATLINTVYRTSLIRMQQCILLVTYSIEWRGNVNSLGVSRSDWEDEQQQQPQLVFVRDAWLRVQSAAQPSPLTVNSCYLVLLLVPPAGASIVDQSFQQQRSSSLVLTVYSHVGLTVYLTAGN